MITLKKRITERLRDKKSYTIYERDLVSIWPRHERDQVKREKKIREFAARNGWRVTILDRAIGATFTKVSV